MKLRGSHLVALAILAAVGGWMLTGELILGGRPDPNTKTIAEREKARTSDAFRVQTTFLQPQQRPERMTVRGRTEASASVTVRAETGGTIVSTAFQKGQMVKPGDPLCTIDDGVRNTNLAQAEAAFEQAQADYDANEKLVERGFATKTKLRGLRSALDAARAALATAKQDMQRTQISATAGGLVQPPYAEAGDNLSPGGVCVTLVQVDPLLFTGQVPERDVANLKTGMEAEIALITGQTVKGSVQNISPVADERTRTYEMEVRIDNSDRALRDGMTASATIELEPTRAFRIDPAWMTLNDDGEIGLRHVGDGNVVAFQPVRILAEEIDGVWVTGPEAGMQVITLGQNYVAQGQVVDPVRADAKSVPPASEASEAKS